MTGLEHYKAAERLLESLPRTGPDYHPVIIAEAQVHATLALAPYTT